MITITLDARELETLRVAMRHLIAAAVVGEIPGDYEVTARTILNRLMAASLAR